MKPEDLLYTSTHEWVHVEDKSGQRVATVGITAFAVEQLTDLVYMELPQPGMPVAQGQEFGEVESVKAVSSLYSPVTGEVVEVNSDLPNKLDVLGEDPYGQGWIIRVRLADDAGLDSLLDYEAYQKQCAESH